MVLSFSVLAMLPITPVLALTRCAGGATPHWKWHHDGAAEVRVLSWRSLRCAAKALSTAVN